MVAVALVAAFALSGCEALRSSVPQKTQVVYQKATVAAVNAPVEGALEGVPSDLPMWPKSKVVAVKTTKTPQGKTWTATLMTTDKYDDVLKGMVAGLQNSGWTVEQADASSGDTKSSLLTLSTPSAQGVLTLSQVDTATTSLEFVISPSK
jgi:hypothetical protein